MDERLDEDGQLEVTRNAPRYGRFPSWLYLLLLTLLSLPALQPILHRLPTCGFDNQFHLWRAVQMEALLRQGILYSRWAPHMAQGYGYPLFLFQSPLSATAAALLHGLGLDWGIALNGVYGLAILASGWSMWLLARELWGDRGAMVTAVAYVYAPYHAYVAHYRASLSETVAWALIPLVLWGLYRWAGYGQRRGLVTAVLSFTLLILTHDVTGYAYFPLLVGWVAALAIWQKASATLWRGGGALLLGLGSSAFFWLPAIVERQQIQFARANSAWPFLYSNNFLPMEQLMAAPRNADPLLLNDWPARGLGFVLIVLAVVGASVAWGRLPHLRWLIGFWVAAALGYTLLTVSATRPLWDTISILQAFQFPWRFLAPATLAAALLAGGIGAGRHPVEHQSSVARIGYPLAALVALMVAGWGWLYPRHCPLPADTTLAGLVAWETATGTVGSTASSELLPNTAQIPPDRFDLPVWEQRLEAAGDWTLLAENALGATWEREVGEAETVRYRAFAFPGWRVLVDGRSVPYQMDEYGLMTLAIPAAAQRLEIAFGETPFWLAADGLALLALLLTAVWAWRSGRGLASPLDAEAPIRWPAALAITGVTLLLIKLLLVDSGYSVPHETRLQDGQLQGVPNPSVLVWGEAGNEAQVRLLGTGFLAEELPADQPLPLFLYWQALQPLGRDYRVGLTLTDADGRRWSAPDLRDYRWIQAAPPADGWPTGGYVQTAYFVDLLPGTPPGTYTLALSLFDRQTLTPLTVYADGQPVGPEVVLGTVDVVAAQRPLTPEAISPQYRLTQAKGPITLHGAAVDRAVAAPGEGALLTLFWQNTGENSVELMLALQDEAGAVAISWPLELPAYGSGVWRSQHLLPLPLTLASGQYQWAVRLGESLASFAELQIDAPERQMEPPPVAVALDQVLQRDGQPQVALVGATLEEVDCLAAGSCAVTLVWRGAAEMAESYGVFVHLLGPDGRIVAQSDGLPANWTRPTTGWLPQEYITDEHRLTIPAGLLAGLPAGEYVLVAGMGDANGRLITNDGADRVELARFRHQP